MRGFTTVTQRGIWVVEFELDKKNHRARRQLGGVGMLRLRSAGQTLGLSGCGRIPLRLRDSFLEGYGRVAPHLDRQDNRGGQQKRSDCYVHDR